MQYSPLRRFLIVTFVAILILLGGVALWTPGIPMLDQPELRRANPLEAVWGRVKAAGSYHFTSDVVQTTIPTVKVTNVGRNSRTEALHLEGQNDLTAQALEFRVWSEGGSVLQADSGLAIRVVDGKTYHLQGDTWQERDSFTEAIAPEGDFMSYLAAVREVTAHEPETRAGITFTRYSFQLDGPTFAEFARREMEAALTARGELPPGLHLDTPRYYREMTGDGELWVREDGLPLRQMLNLRFPEQDDSRVQAQITVDFSQFGQTRFQAGQFVQVDAQSGLGSSAPPLSPPLGGRKGGWQSLYHRVSEFNIEPWLALLLALALIALMVRYHRLRTVQTAISLAMIASMLVSPTLNALHITSFFEVQAARAEEQNARQRESDMLREARMQDTSTQFDPHQNPLSQADSPLLPPPLGGDEGGGQPAAISSPQEIEALTIQATNVLTEDNGVDTDNDGLTDFVEQRIGTREELADTDGDLILDNVEVAGFTSGGQTWYTDPRNFDSNDDGLADTEEWGDLTSASPPDTDGDGVPDLFDDDNDGDKVPDRLDLAPFTRVDSLSEANPFNLTINNLSVGRPTFVDFQLRPNRQNNLWFAGNVLDWPRDNQGQVQDVDGKTYADYAIANGLVPKQNEDFGDLKLIPMLEIRIPDDSLNLPSDETLAAYQILHNDLDTASNEKLVYVPLSIVSDRETGGRVAFSGRMLYERETAPETWLNAHEIRLAWVVQMLQDIPCSLDDPEDVAKGCQAGTGDVSGSYIFNTPTVIHTYYDDWTLTGLNVREEHGTDIALLYEDPTIDTNPKDETALTVAAAGLERVFVKGIDCDTADPSTQTCVGDGARDLTVQDLHDRFDHTSTNRPPETDPNRMGITGERDILTVTPANHYDTLDWALTQTVTETHNVLNTFANQWNTDNAVKPLVMYAYETRLRSLGLDAVRTDLADADQYVALNNNELAIDLAPTGLSPTPIQVLAGMKWAAYCADPGSGPSWNTCDIIDYWNELEVRYAAEILSDFPDAADPDVARGRLGLAQLYWLTLAQGVNNAVAYQEPGQPEELVTSPSFAFDLSGIGYNLELETLLQGGKLGYVVLLNFITLKLFNEVEDTSLLAYVGKTFNGRKDPATFARLGRTLKSGAAGKAGVAAVMFVGVGLVASGAVLSATGSARDQLIGNALLQSVVIAYMSTTQIVLPIVTVLEVANAAQSGSRLATLGSALVSRSEVVGVTRVASFAGAVISIGITWGFFLFDNNLEPGSLAYNVALAQTIAATIYIILLTALSVTIVGLIVVGLLSVIDALATLICETGGPGRQGDGSCFTIGGTITKAIGEQIYTYASLVDIKDPNMMVVGNPDFTLTDRARGFVVGAAAIVTLPVTTTVKHKNPQRNALYYHTNYLSAENLKTTTFSRTLSPGETALDVEAGQMPDEWHVSRNGKWCSNATGICLPGQEIQLYKAVDTTDISAMVEFTTPGLNHFPPLYLNTGYALPAYECWGLFEGTKCAKKVIKDHNSSLFDPFQFDIFPASVDRFMGRVSASTGGLALSWDPAFEALWDADGDGLISPAYNGNDPDDGSWDHDGDGLSDAFELQQRVNGVNVSPLLDDTDGDGLSDRQEMQFGTNPVNADTDNDGLLDGEEIWHRTGSGSTFAGGWDISVPGIGHPVRVSSDPTRSDSDGDGIGDGAERQLAQDADPAKRLDDNNVPYHPNVFNSSPLKIYTTIFNQVNNVEVESSYVQPSQSFNYQTTVLATTPLAPSILDVHVPAGLGGSPPPSLLNFDPQTFSGTQTVVQQTSLVLDAALNSQVTALSSTVRARLEPTGPADLEWNIEGVDMGFSPNTWLSAVDPFEAQRPDRYLIGTLTSDDYGSTGTNGFIQTNVFPEGWLNIVDQSDPRRPANDASPNPIPQPAIQPTDYDPADLRGATPPDVACNNDGQCMIVWDQELCKTIIINSIKVVREGPDGGSGIEPFIYFIADPNDTDPTDGGYELIWDAPGNGGNDMQAGELRNETLGYGFPKTIEICGEGRIDVYEGDTNTYDYDDPDGSKTDWSNMELTNGFYVNRDGIDCDNSLNGENPCLFYSGRLSGATVNLAQADRTPEIELATNVYPNDDYYVVEGAIISYDAGIDNLVSQPVTISNNRSGIWSNFGPVVASDGTDFLVAYEQAKDPATAIRIHRFDANGVQLNARNRGIENPRLAADDTNSVALDLVWAGDHYILAWKFIRDCAPRPCVVPSVPIMADDLEPNGASRTGGFVQLSGMDSGVHEAHGHDYAGPVLAYNPNANRTLLLYKHRNNDLRRVLLGDDVTNAGAPDWLLYDGTSGGRVYVDQFPFSVAYNPMLNGWLITHSSGQGSHLVTAMLMKANLSTKLIDQVDLARFNTGTSGPEINGPAALACPAPSSLPTVELRFEELPGSTTFVDSAKPRQNATCSGSTCPAAGAAGARDMANNPVGQPASDYALLFNEANDELTFPNPVSDGLTLAFWYKANPGIGDFYIRAGQNNNGQNDGFEFYINSNSNVLTFLAGGEQLLGSLPNFPDKISDGTWHHVAATRASGSGALKIYIDGNLIAEGPTSPALTPAANVRIGRSFGSDDTQVNLDNLKLYRTALDQAGIQQLYNNGELPAYCVSATEGHSVLPPFSPHELLKVSVNQPDTRGGSIVASGGMPLTVDADAPTAMVTVPANNAYVKGSTGTPNIVTIEGTAADPTSFISQVEVNAGAGWEDATGTETWLHQLSVTEGVYTVQARATDAVGNLGPDSAPSRFIADGTPPTIGITPPAGAIIVPNGDAQTGWTVSLSGPANDPAIGSEAGSGVASVEVTLESRETGQTYGLQQAAVQAAAWNIDYQLPTYLADPSGSYTLTVKAEDAVGNRSASVVSTINLDITGPEVELSQLDRARLFIADTLTINGIISDTGEAGVAGLEINFQSVEEVAAFPEGTEVSQALSQVTWTDITLATSGAGVASSAWGFSIPADLEGEYQMNLRSTDDQGNVRLHPNVWRGIIDTRAPRVTFTATPSGATYQSDELDGGALLYDIRYNCVAEDRYLNEPDFDCWGNRIQPPLRSFNTDPILQTIFPDRTILNRLENTYARWEDSPQPVATLQACDVFGHCATATTGQTAAVAQSRAAAKAAMVSTGQGPLAVIVSPTQGRYVAATGNIPVTIAAEAAAGLQQVTLSLDGAVIETLPFDQSENITRTQRTIAVPVVGEVEHTLVAQATDWAGVVQQTLYPVSFTLDTQLPTVTLNTDLLGLAQTWGLGSDVLRFNGTATDSVGLAAVQIKIGQAPFVDVTFDGNVWYTAQQVPDPEGQTLAIKVRAIDRAGRLAEVAGSIGVDLSTSNPPDTAITVQPPNPSSVNGADFSFEGTDGDGNEVSAFGCRLDEGEFVACGSPKAYTDLSNGLHRFEVRAIDDEGFVDPTPASVEWLVQVTQLETFIDQSPTDPTFSRDATFVFTGGEGVTGFECALDSGAYSVCSSPQTYNALSDGQHTFLVRGLDDAGNKGAATRFTWRVENVLPVADDQFVTTFQGAAVDITLTASDNDALTYQLVDLPGHGFAQLIAPNVVRYSPDSGFGGQDSFTFRASDQDGSSNLATVTILVNAEPVIAVDTASVMVQYSDGITPVTLLVSDNDSPGSSLTISSVSWTTDTVNVYAGLPPQLSLNEQSNNADIVPGQATWLLSGTTDLPAGAYIVTVVADDGVGGAIAGEPVDIVIQVTPEDAMVRFHGGNPRAVQVATAGDDNSGPFELRVDVKELYPDNGTAVLPGDIALANVTVELAPIGPGPTALPTGCTTELHDVDYDARLTVTCTFDSVPINTYAVEVTVDGGYYSRFDEDVVTVYDPSRGFTTGGGSFIWPGSDDPSSGYAGDETTFGFTIEYNSSGKNVKGRLMLIRRRPDGSHSIKSNALDGLALGDEGDFTWASFSGKTTYQSPDMEQPEGNHTFIAYVEDHGDTGDRFWLQVKDKDGNVITALSLDEEAAANATLIDAGSIVVPGGGSGVRTAIPDDAAIVDQPFKLFLPLIFGPPDLP